jgi:tryptophan synthase beta chain
MSRLEGIIPRSKAPMLGYLRSGSRQDGKEETILVNLSGRGDKDMDYVMDHYPLEAYEEQKLW